MRIIVNTLLLLQLLTILAAIDGSDGVWKIPQARLPIIFQHLKDHGLTSQQIKILHNHLNQQIEGWGDIFADLEIKDSS